MAAKEKTSEPAAEKAPAAPAAEPAPSSPTKEAPPSAAPPPAKEMTSAAGKAEKIEETPAPEKTPAKEPTTEKPVAEKPASEALPPALTGASDVPAPTPAETLFIDLMRGHQNLMIEWFQAVRGDVGILYQRLEQMASEAAANPAGGAAFSFNSLPPQPQAPAPRAATPPPPAPEPVAPPTHAAVVKADSAARWEGLVFGTELAGIGALADQRRELIRGLMEEEPAALTLAGQLMIFRAASGDRLPVLLKDLGEAYYRWNPASAGRADEFRDRLAGWMQRQCERGGSMMKIQLVQPGDRFDTKQHNARDPGVEVTEVYGWVVLRDNGKVYTKANVAVK